jgi:sec-independent protein translocase protein TatA
LDCRGFDANLRLGGIMGEGLFQPLHLILIIGIALLVFGTGKFTAVGKGLGEGIRNFKSAMKEPEEEKKKEKEEEKKS